jgi:hypothetical protein
MAEHTLHFIVFEEDGCFLAQALEVDLVYQAERREDLCYEVHRGLAAQVAISHQEGMDPFDMDAPPKGVERRAVEGPYKVHFTVQGDVVTFDDDSTWRTVP